MDITLERVLGRFELGEPQRFDRLTLYPVVGLPTTEDEPQLLSEALEAGTLELGEISEQGNVPSILGLNKGVKAVLGLEGETLVGAKQDRVLNASVLIAPGSRVMLPVSCVERGRWGYEAKRFSAGSMANATLRAKKQKAVSNSLCTTQSRMANQQEVWDEVGRVSTTLGVTSSTGTLHDSYRGMGQRLAGYRDAFARPPAAQGVVAVIDDLPIAVELLGSPRLLERVWAKLVESWVIEALTREPRPVSSPDASKVRRLVERVIDSEVQSYPAVGLGKELRLSGSGVVGSALLHEGLLHLSAFQVN